MFFSMPPKFPLVYLLLFFLLVVHFDALTLAQKTDKNTALVPAIIVFGDSIVDPGNNNVIDTLVKCDFPPYGIDFVDQIPTGRFCNGRIPSDFIASKLGVKELLPAYLDPNLEPQELLTGVSFASGGAGYDPITSQTAHVISMDDQLELYKEYQEKLRAIGGNARAESILSKGLHVVCVGSDDIANTYFPTLFRRLQYDIPSYADLVVNYASSFFQGLIKLGARKIGVVGIPPIGCVPSQRTLAGGLFRECAPFHNQLAELVNSKLNQEIQRLGSIYQGTVLIYINIYDTLVDIIQNPNKYDFEVATNGCCGTGLLEVSILCNSLTSFVCANVSDHVFWDSYHPTERAYQILVDIVIENVLPLIIS
ncbi:putative triacylglycerol lipase [Dioscorea sansibarensis]